MVNISLPHNYKPRKYQLPILKALDSGKKRCVWVAHRRSGKDVTILNWVIKSLFKEVCTAFYVLPTYAQAKKVIWDAINNDGFRIIDYFPKEVIKSKHQQEMKISLINGSMFQLVGSDNIDSLVGTNPKIVVFSEYALQSPQAWEFLRPILRANGGVAIFISTPRGKNHFHEMTIIAGDNSADWFYEKLTIDDTGVVSKEDYAKEIKEGMSEELALQEYYCSFDRGIEGSFYGKLLDKLWTEKRICSVPYDTSANVNVAWDIGYGDSTSLVFWQQVGAEVRVIDYYENQGEGIVHYAKVLQNKPYVYGTHFLPHDAGAGSIQTGMTVQQIARQNGIKSVLLKRNSLESGIELTRGLLSHCYIDQEKCKRLIDCLTNYHKKFNEKMNCYSAEPVHDWSSHGADAFRYLAQSRNEYGVSASGGLTPDKIKDMRQRNLGY